MKNEQPKTWQTTTIKLSQPLRKSLDSVLPLLQADYPAVRLTQSAAICLLMQEAIRARGVSK